MAFLKENKYIKLNANGEFKVYPSLASRLKHKSAPSSEDILQKYLELKLALNKQLCEFICSKGYTEEALTDPALYNELMALPGISEFCNKLEEVSDEAYFYSLDLQYENGAQHDFPIMEKFYPNVKDSIPEVIESAGIGFWKSSNLADMYEEAKRDKLFGETEDC